MFNDFYKEIFDGVSFKNDYLQEEIDQKKTFSNFTQLYKLPKYLEKVFLKYYYCLIF